MQRLDVQRAAWWLESGTPRFVAPLGLSDVEISLTRRHFYSVFLLKLPQRLTILREAEMVRVS